MLSESFAEAKVTNEKSVIVTMLKVITPDTCTMTYSYKAVERDKTVVQLLYELQPKLSGTGDEFAESFEDASVFSNKHF